MSGIDSLRVFFIEDETMVALNLEDMLLEMGCTIAGTAMRLERARDQIESGIDADVAILDVNVAGEQVFPVAEMLDRRGVPIVFATGYDRDGLPESWHERAILQKPYTQEEVRRAILKAIGRS
jgi:two-component SAPR family response regulator